MTTENPREAFRKFDGDLFINKTQLKMTIVCDACEYDSRDRFQIMYIEIPKKD